MKLWIISQDVNDGYDTYDSAVVAAKDEQSARMTHPSERRNPWDGRCENYSSWCEAGSVKVEYLGKAAPGVEAGVVLGSFRAG